CLDAEVEVVAKALARLRAKIAGVGLCRAEESETHCQLSETSSLRSHRLRPARDRNRAGDLEDEALGAGVDHARAEGVGKAQRLDAVLALAAHLHHCEFALDPRHL